MVCDLCYKQKTGFLGDCRAHRTSLDGCDKNHQSPLAVLYIGSIRLSTSKAVYSFFAAEGCEAVRFTVLSSRVFISHIAESCWDFDRKHLPQAANKSPVCASESGDRNTQGVARFQNDPNLSPKLGNYSLLILSKFPQKSSLNNLMTVLVAERHSPSFL